jgi:arsenate reductase
MAEGWAKYFARLSGDDIEVQSAGIEAHGQNPRAIAVMQEAGVDISLQESSKLTNDMLSRADILVTVCGHADEHCPAIPSGKQKIHWPLNDPAKATGSEEDVMQVFRATRDEIRDRVQTLLEQINKQSA